LKNDFSLYEGCRLIEYSPNINIKKTEKMLALKDFLTQHNKLSLNTEIVWVTEGKIESFGYLRKVGNIFGQIKMEYNSTIENRYNEYEKSTNKRSSYMAEFVDHEKRTKKEFIKESKKARIFKTVEEINNCKSLKALEKSYILMGQEFDHYSIRVELGEATKAMILGMNSLETQLNEMKILSTLNAVRKNWKGITFDVGCSGFGVIFIQASRFEVCMEKLKFDTIRNNKMVNQESFMNLCDEEQNGNKEINMIEESKVFYMESKFFTNKEEFLDKCYYWKQQQYLEELDLLESSFQTMQVELNELQRVADEKILSHNSIMHVTGCNILFQRRKRKLNFLKEKGLSFDEKKITPHQLDKLIMIGPNPNYASKIQNYFNCNLLEINIDTLFTVAQKYKLRLSIDDESIPEMLNNNLVENFEGKLKLNSTFSDDTCIGYCGN